MVNTAAGAAGDAAKPVTFEDLVTTATVGVSRRPLDITALGGPAAAHASVVGASAQVGGGPVVGGDPAVAVLDAAALLDAARRAGARAARGVSCPPAAPDDTAPELSARAARTLRQIGGTAAPGFAAVDSDLLTDLLTAAARAGYVVPAPLLPGLLDAAVRTPPLRPAVAAVLGARGRWLTAHRPDWQRAVAEALAGQAAGADDPELWRTGSRAERRGYLTSLRDRDPVAARELLAAGWARETGEDRAALLAVLARGLSPDDEEFLDSALDDRAEAVRARARRMLTRLPGSAFNRRAAERAAAVLRLAGHGARRRLVATPPRLAEVGAVAVRDGISPRPPSPGIGAGAWLLTQVIAAAPLDGWTRLFGLPPARIVALPVEDGLGIDVRAGWRLAAVSRPAGSGEWARALLAAGDPDRRGDRPPDAWANNTLLSAVLPPDIRAAHATALLSAAMRHGGASEVYDAITEVARCPIPWPPGLADAVLAALSRTATLMALPRLPRGLLTAAARGLPATGDRDYAARLTRLADAAPRSWAPLLRSAAETITLRRSFLEEIR